MLKIAHRKFSSCSIWYVSVIQQLGIKIFLIDQIHYQGQYYFKKMCFHQGSLLVLVFAVSELFGEKKFYVIIIFIFWFLGEPISLKIDRKHKFHIYSSRICSTVNSLLTIINPIFFFLFYSIFQNREKNIR